MEDVSAKPNNAPGRETVKHVPVCEEMGGQQSRQAKTEKEEVNES